MGIFDASNRDQCEVKRMRTNTPLQALVMMNDPTVLEASRVLAQQLYPLATHPRSSPAPTPTPKPAITKAFRLIICRRPTAKEAGAAILKDYYDQQLNAYQTKTRRGKNARRR